MNGQEQPTTATPPRPQVTVGTLIARTFSVWTHNFVRFAGVMVVLQVPALLLGWALGAPLAATYGGNPFKTPSPEVGAFLYGPGWWAVIVVGGLLGLVQMGALTSGAIQHLAGRKASVGEMLGSGLRRLLPILIAGVLALLAVYLGLVLLLVPGIIVALMFSLTVPVVMAESLGPLKTLGRSRALTRGHRWKLLGTFAVIYLITGGLAVLVAVVSEAAGPVGPVLVVAAGAVLNSLVYVAPAVAYHDLRVAGEGIDTAQLARVFE